MGKIGGNTWGIDDIVEGELINERRGLEEKRQWLRNCERWPLGYEEGLAVYLTNASGGTCNDGFDHVVERLGYNKC